MGELSAAEERVRAGDGVLGTPGYDEVASGQGWPASRQVRAAVVVELLTRRDPPRRTVSVEGALIVGDLDLSKVTTTSPLFLRRCFVDGDLSLAGARTDRVDLDGCHVRGRLVATSLVAQDSVLVTNAVCEAGVWMPGAEVRGTLGFSGSRMGGHGSGSLQAAYLTARSFVMTAADCDGRVDLQNAHVTGSVTLNGTYIRGTDDVALGADSLRAASLACQGDAATGREFRALGTVRLLDARVDAGTVNFAGASLAATRRGEVDDTGDALVASRLRCSAGVFLRNGFTAVGAVDVRGAAIGGQLDCSAAHLQGSPVSLRCDRTTIGEDLLLNRSFTAAGTVHLNGTTVDQQLSLRSSTLTGTTGPALVVNDVRANQLVIDWAAVPLGVVDLTGSTVGTLVDDPGTWPAPGDLVLGDLTYRSLAVPGTAAQRLGWLARDRYGYVPGAYEVLAAAFRLQGDEDSAREVLIGKQRARREHTGGRHAPARWWSAFLRWTVGYGYAPARIVPWFVGLLLAGWVLFAGPLAGAMVATGDSARVRGFQAFLYVLDLLLPVASLGVRDGWTPTGAAQVVVVAWTLAGWVLGLTLVAAISGALRRD